MLIWFIAACHALLGCLFAVAVIEALQSNNAVNAVAGVALTALSFATIYALVMP